MAAEDSLTSESPVQVIEGWTIGKRLGYGAFSFAHECTRTEDGVERRACAKFTKHIDASVSMAEAKSAQQQQEIETEISALQSIESDNIVKLFGYFPMVEYRTRGNELVECHLMILEICPGGNLFDILYYTGRFDEPLARTLFKQILEGVMACHSVHVAHRDVKAQNVVLDEDYNCKIIDFGSSKRWLPRTQMQTHRVGTKGYQAPELLLNMGYTYKADVFSLGVLLFIMLARSIPFQEAKIEDRNFRTIAKAQYKKFWKRYSALDLSDEVKDLLNNMLTYQPLQRWRLSAIHEHPWIQGPLLTPEQVQNRLKALHVEAQERHAQDEGRAMDRFDSLKGEVGQHRGAEIQYPTIPNHCRMFAFELDDENDGLNFLKIAEKYIETDLQGEVVMKEDIFEVVGLVEVHIEEQKYSAAIRINIFQEHFPEAEEEYKHYCVFRRFQIENDDDTAFMYLQDRLKVLFTGFKTPEV